MNYNLFIYAGRVDGNYSPLLSPFCGTEANNAVCMCSAFAASACILLNSLRALFVAKALFSRLDIEDERWRNAELTPYEQFVPVCCLPSIEMVLQFVVLIASERGGEHVLFVRVCASNHPRMGLPFLSSRRPNTSFGQFFQNSDFDCKLCLLSINFHERSSE